MSKVFGAMNSKQSVKLLMLIGVGCIAGIGAVTFSVGYYPVLCASTSNSSLLSVAQEATVKPLPNDPLKALDNSAKAPKGEIVYAADIVFSELPSSQNYLIVRPTGSTKNPPGTKYRVIRPDGNVIFSPQFSPTGRYISFYYGWPYDDTGTSSSYFFDRETGRTMIGPGDNSTYPMQSWSPDGTFLAYFKGGDRSGEATRYIGESQLYTYRLKDGKTWLISARSGANDFSWTSQGTILYTDTTRKAVSSGEAGVDRRPTSDPIAITSVRPSIREASSTGGVADKVILPSAFGPHPSPDGHWLAFFGWSQAAPNTNFSQKVAGNKSLIGARKGLNTGLCLYNRVNSDRVLIRPIPLSQIDFDSRRLELLWSSNSKRLFVLDKAAGVSGTSDETHRQAVISYIDVQTLQTHKVATLQATSLGTIEPLFAMVGVSDDGFWIICKIIQVVKSEQDGSNTTSTSLVAVNTESGSFTTLAQTENYKGSSLGIDWHSATVSVNERRN